MFSKQEVNELTRGTTRRVRAAVLVAVFSATAIGVYAYLSPASDAAVAVSDDRPDIANSAGIEPWSAYLSRDAVDSYGIEADLDGNASALVPPDQLLAGGMR